MPELQTALATLGLLDPDAETEAVRNVMVAPLAGLDPAEPFDVRPIALAIDDALTSDMRLHALPAKFGCWSMAAARCSIAGERADICLAAVGDAIAFGLDTPRERIGWARCRQRRRPTRRSRRRMPSWSSPRAAACAA